MKTYSDRPRKRRSRKDTAASDGGGPKDRAKTRAAHGKDPAPPDKNGAVGPATEKLAAKPAAKPAAEVAAKPEAKPEPRRDDPATPGNGGNGDAGNKGVVGEIGSTVAPVGTAVPVGPGSADDAFALIERNLGAVYNLLSQVPMGAREPLRKLNWTVLPAVALRQFRLVRDKDGTPVAYVSWALFSQRVEEKITKLPIDDKLFQSIVPSDWNSGERPFIIDLYAKEPKVGQLLVTRIKRELFPNTELRARGIRAGGKETEWLVVKPRQPGKAPPAAPPPAV